MFRMTNDKGPVQETNASSQPSQSLRHYYGLQSNGCANGLAWLVSILELRRRVIHYTPMASHISPKSRHLARRGCP